MKLTEDQMILLREKLKVKYGCENCGSETGINIEPHEYQLISCSRDAVSINEPERITPIVVTSCPACGYVKLFNLITIGVVKE